MQHGQEGWNQIEGRSDADHASESESLSEGPSESESLIQKWNLNKPN